MGSKIAYVQLETSDLLYSSIFVSPIPFKISLASFRFLTYIIH